MALTKTNGTADDPRVVRMAQAIAKAEGFGVPGALPTVRNNPGDIMERTASGGYQVRTYPTVEAGWAALYRQVTKMLYGGSSLYDPSWPISRVAKTYTGEAAYMNWARNVARFLNVSTETPFNQAV